MGREDTVGEDTTTDATSDGISRTTDVISDGISMIVGGETTVVITAGPTGRHLMVIGATLQATDTITRAIETIRIGDTAVEWRGIDGGDIIGTIAGMATIRIIRDQGRSTERPFRLA